MAASSSQKRAKVGSPASLRDPDERLPLAERALAAGERERAGELLAERSRAVARRELERLPQRLAGAEREREHRDRLRQVEEDRLPPPLHLRSQHEIGNEEARDGEEQQDAGRGQASARGRVGKERDERHGERHERLVREEAGERLPAARLAQVALVGGAQAGEPGWRLEPEPATRNPARAQALGPREADGERRPAEGIGVGEKEPAGDEARAREEEHGVHRPPPVRRGSGTRPSRSMSR